MKRFKLLILLALTGIFFVSCGNKEEKHLLALKKHSRETALNSYIKHANEYFLYSALKENGTIENNFSIEKIGEELSGEIDIPFKPINSDSINKSGGERNFTFVNDKKNKTLTYSYDIKIKDLPEIPLTFRIGNKNIEACSPIIIDKTFIVPADGLGKFFALIFPQDFLSYLNADFSYDSIKRIYSIKADRHTQKRYDKAEKAMYKNAQIEKTEQGYKVTFDNNQLRQFLSMLWYAIKHDSRLKLIIDIYQKFLSENKLKENISDFSLDNLTKINIPENFKLTEEIIVKDDLISQNFIVLSSDKFALKISYRIGDYEHILNDSQFNIKIETPDNIAGAVNIDFISKGISDSSKLDTSILMTVNSSINNTSIDMNYQFLIDKTKEKDNFMISATINTKNILSNKIDTMSNEKFETIKIEADGNFKKTENSIEYNINKIKFYPHIDNIKSIDINQRLFITDKITKEFYIPSEKIYVLETKPEEWGAISNEAVTNIKNLSGKFE